MSRRWLALLAGGALSFLLAGCGLELGPPSNQPAPKSVELETTDVTGLGTVLTNSSGFVLYVFAPDRRQKVTCTPNCQDVWPPVTGPAKGLATAGQGVKQSLIGSLPNPVTHKSIVTYDGWPLYTYVSDEQQGQASGQNINLNGGYWWVITPSGKLITKNPPRSAATN